MVTKNCQTQARIDLKGVHSIKGILFVDRNKNKNKKLNKRQAQNKKEVVNEQDPAKFQKQGRVNR